MAEELNPPGYNVDPGAYTLDLYRLLCMVEADQRVAKLGSTSYYSAIARLRREYLDNEVKRALISSATALRIWLDQRPKRAFADMKTNCGKLFPDWPKQKKMSRMPSTRGMSRSALRAPRAPQ
jgi:hypothetical protein